MKYIINCNEKISFFCLIFRFRYVMNFDEVKIMLIKYSVSNFGSFNTPVELRFEKGSSRQHPSHLIQNKYLTGVAIYGPNASGKSNLLKSLFLLMQSILYGNIDMLMLNINRHAFTDTDITDFVISFMISEKKYEYRIKIKPSGIFSEKLELLNDNSTPSVVFERLNNGVTFGSLLTDKWFKARDTVMDKIPYISKLRSDAIEVLDIPNKEPIIDVLKFFQGLVFFNDKSILNLERFYKEFKTTGFKKFLKQLLSSADVGISDVILDEISPDLTKNLLNFVHPTSLSILNEEGGCISFINNSNDFYFIVRENGKNVGYTLLTMHGNKKFEPKLESTGTIRLINFSLCLYMYKYSSEDTLLLIDEMDSSIHSFLVKKLLKELLQTSNANNSQFIVTLHNTLLMDIKEIWRDDEIWFMKKEFDHSSKLYSLADFEPRYDKIVGKDYVNGKYGAIPFLAADLILDNLE